MVANNFYNTVGLYKFNMKLFEYSLDSELLVMNELRDKLLNFEKSAFKNLESDIKSVIQLDHLLIYQRLYDARPFPTIILHEYFVILLLTNNYVSNVLLFEMMIINLRNVKLKTIG